MKKSIFLAVAAVAMTACSNDVDLGMKDANKQTADNAIGFEVRNSNMSRGTQGLEDTGHYNFGVFAYKDAASNPAIMENYLVGYMDATNKKGYYMTPTNQTTQGDPTGSTPGQSMWAYEKLGYKDYTYTRSEGYYYYTKDDTDYMSNFRNQFLRYWDKSTDWTKFYAYAPYIHGTGSNDPLNENVVTFDNDNHKMTFPAGTIKDGYDDPSKYEYLYAATKVENSAYGNDVALKFKHINSKIMITFWEDIAGYSVKMINLREAGTGVTEVGISAAPAKIETGNYLYGTLAKTASATLTFTDPDKIANPIINSSTFTATTYYSGSDADKTNNEFLTFKAPLADKLATQRPDAVSTTGVNNNFSGTVYYGIPKDSACGLTFHCSFELTNEQTGETITVKNARVHVSAANCAWEAGKRYIYVFKITKAATGTTGDPETIIPGDPNVPSENALYPIVFDNIKVEDWTDVTDPSGDDSHNIN